MKKLFFYLLIAVASFAGCSEDDDNGPKVGCLTAIPKGGSDRVTIRCCTHEQFNAGSNVEAGGTAGWNDYTDHEWEAVSSCDKCK